VIRNRTSDLECFDKIFRWHDYEVPFEISPKFIVDAGANIGMATAFFASRYPAARIVAVEPEPSNFAVLQRNCAGLANVSLVNAALWPNHNSLSINDSGAEKWAFFVSEGAGPAPGATSVRAVTIPDLMSEFGMDRIDLLKLDIEGAEKGLFERGTEQWLGSVGAIAIELHDRIFRGCAQQFYAAVGSRPFRQESRNENIFIEFLPADRPRPPGA
jgi:FkbM family methyltransferase